MIFSFLDDIDNASNAQVCKLWSTVALDVIWKEPSNLHRLFSRLVPLVLAEGSGSGEYVRQFLNRKLSMIRTSNYVHEYDLHRYSNTYPQLMTGHGSTDTRRACASLCIPRKALSQTRIYTHLPNYILHMATYRSRAGSSTTLRTRAHEWTFSRTCTPSYGCLTPTTRAPEGELFKDTGLRSFQQA
jgi:hypothetical protein